MSKGPWKITIEDKANGGGPKATLISGCATMTFTGVIAENCRKAVMGVLTESMGDQGGLFAGIGAPEAPATGEETGNGGEG